MPFSRLSSLAKVNAILRCHTETVISHTFKFADSKNSEKTKTHLRHTSISHNFMGVHPPRHP